VILADIRNGDISISREEGKREHTRLHNSCTALSRARPPGIWVGNIRYRMVNCVVGRVDI